MAFHVTENTVHIGDSCETNLADKLHPYSQNSHDSYVAAASSIWQYT